MKFAPSLLFLFAAPDAKAFVPQLGKPSCVQGRHLMSMVVERAETDLTIPYDAAARLAYDDWREQFNKGPFNPERFEVFKANYEAVTIANVVAKKNARQEGTDAPALMKLNEFGDCTEEEYNALASGVPTTTGDVLSKALDAANSQSEASSALKDAADALAEEEEALARKLGLESVDELEVALDSMEGIAADGGELETDNIAGEARARSAYLDWCKDFGKEPDESRYQTFVNNFGTMEKFAKETGKEMNLNEYADCTEEEYVRLTQAKSQIAAASAPQPESEESKVDPWVALTQSVEIEQKARAELEAAEKKRQELKAEAIRQQAAARALQLKEEEERRQALEKEKAAREAARSKENEKAAAAVAAAAIAAAKAQAEKEAKQVAERRALAEKAAQAARRKAKEWEIKQQRVSASQNVLTPEPTKPVSFEFRLPFMPAPAPAPAQKPKPVVGFFGRTVAKPAAKAAPQKGDDPISGFFSNLFKESPSASSVASRSPKATVSSQPRKSAVSPPSAKAAVSPFSFFGTPAQQPSSQKVPKASVVQPKVTRAPAPKAAAKPAVPAFSFFGSAPKTTPEKKVQAPPVVAPAPAPVAAKPSFSFFASSPAPEIKKQVPAPAPVALPSIKAPPNPVFSFFGGPTAQKQAPKPKEAKVEPKIVPKPVKEVARPTAVKIPEPSRAATFSLFGSTSAPKPEIKKQEPVLSNRPGTINLFGSTPTKIDQKKVEPEIPNRSGTLSLFPLKVEAAKKVAPSPKSVSKPATVPKVVAKKVAPAKAPPGVPTLSRWTQNSDGSITGIISGSQNFRPGTKITTSPIKTKGESGIVVQTGSGSKYFLQ